MKVEEINDIRELDSLRNLWRRLWQSTPGGSFFQSLEWLEAVWAHCPVEQRLRVLVVEDSEEPVGILPFVVRREVRRLGTARVLTFPLDDWGPYYGPIGKRPQETLQVGLEYLARGRRDWDVLDLRWTPPETSDSADTLATLARLDLHSQTTMRHRTSLIDLEGSWDDYVKQRSKNWRSHHRRRQKRIAESGEARYLRYRPQGEEQGEADPRWDLYDTCVELAAKSWQGSSETGNTLNHEAVRGTLRAVHEQAARLGCLDLNLLYLDERPISFAYNYYHQGRVFALRLGYDPEMSKLGPGNRVEELAIEDSYARGDQIYELGPDAEASKRSLRTRVEPIWQHTHYPPYAMRSQLLRLKAIAAHWTQSLSKSPVATTCKS